MFFEGKAGFEKVDITHEERASMNAYSFQVIALIKRSWLYFYETYMISSFRISLMVLSS